MENTQVAQKVGVTIAVESVDASTFWVVRMAINGQPSFLEGVEEGGAARALSAAIEKVAASLTTPSSLIADLESLPEGVQEAIATHTGPHKMVWVRASTLPENPRKSIEHANQAVQARLAECISKAREAANEKPQEIAAKEPEKQYSKVEFDEEGRPIIQESTGKVTGKPMFKVRGFDMPWCGTPEDAIDVYGRLKKAIETGYFKSVDVAKKPKP